VNPVDPVNLVNRCPTFFPKKQGFDWKGLDIVALAAGAKVTEKEFGDRMGEAKEAQRLPIPTYHLSVGAEDAPETGA
jgi:hypothetical protein